MKEILNNLNRVKGVMGSMLVGKDGIIAASDVADDVDQDHRQFGAGHVGDRLHHEADPGARRRGEDLQPGRGRAEDHVAHRDLALPDESGVGCKKPCTSKPVMG